MSRLIDVDAIITALLYDEVCDARNNPLDADAGAANR